MDRRIGIALLVLALAVPAGAATIVEMRHLPARPYTVVQGDSLSSLAWRMLGHSRAEPSLQRQVTHAKATFAPGATIRVRPIHIAVRVEEGDTWASLAAQYRGLTGPGAPAWLAAWNGTSPHDGLVVGMVVQVPPALGTELAAAPAGTKATLTPVMLNVHGQQLKTLAERRAAYRPKVQDPVYAFTWMGQPDVDPQAIKQVAPARPAPTTDAGGQIGVVAVNPSTISPAAKAEATVKATEHVKAILAEYEYCGLVASPLVAAEALAGCHPLAHAKKVESMPSCDESICLHPPHSMAVPCGDPFETVRYDLTPGSSTPVVPSAPIAPVEDAAQPATPSIREKILGAGAPPFVPLVRPVTTPEPVHVIAPERPVAAAPRSLSHGSLDEALYGAPPVPSVKPEQPVQPASEDLHVGLYGRSTSPVISDQLKAVRTRIKNLRGSLTQPVPVAPVEPSPAIASKQIVIPPPAPAVAAPIITSPTTILTSPAPIAPAPVKAASIKAPIRTAAPTAAPVRAASTKAAPARKSRSALGRFGSALRKLVGMDRPNPATERADVTHLIHHLPSARGIPSPGVMSDLAPIRVIEQAQVRVDPPAKKADPEPDSGYNWTMPAQARR